MSAVIYGQAVESDLERHRVELRGYCYRMLGSAFDADDAVQETLLRAWRGLDGFEGRASLRSWLYRIATNVCVDMARGNRRRAHPADLTGNGEDAVEPVPDRLVVPDGDPADQVAARETIKLAFVAALQHLPPRQRAVLILREVLRWSANEVAELLGLTPAAVNSALQRARATLAAVDPVRTDPLPQPKNALLMRYVDAFERFDLDALTALLDLDATLAISPYVSWLQGRDEIRNWWDGPGSGCRGSMLCRLTANGAPAFGQYRPGGNPWALQVLDISAGRIIGINTFLDTERLFPLFELPARAPAA
ncbi:MAG: sigma-70 family RNA polymerase sigma factor [Streptosporangiales bacterium]|nr:sigma-70 family RNA polymerase sigma factor [Streptosporangiales bacterium]